MSFEGSGRCSLICATKSGFVLQLSQASRACLISAIFARKAEGLETFTPSFTASSGRFAAPWMAARRSDNWRCWRVALLAICSASLIAESSKPNKSAVESVAPRSATICPMACIKLTAWAALLPSWTAFSPTAWSRSLPGALVLIR